jgi:hypothetical protein
MRVKGGGCLCGSALAHPLVEEYAVSASMPSSRPSLSLSLDTHVNVFAGGGAVESQCRGARVSVLPGSPGHRRARRFFRFVAAAGVRAESVVVAVVDVRVVLRTLV